MERADMAMMLEAHDGSANRGRGDDRTSAATVTVKARVFAHLDAHSDLARRPGKIAAALHVPTGSAKRLAHEWRKEHAPSLEALLGPVLLQNVRIVGRTDPGGAAPGSPLPRSLFRRLGPWRVRAKDDHSDNKLTATVDLRHLDGKAEISIGGGTLELILSSPKGLTASEVLLALSLLRLPWDGSEDVSIAQLEVFRDGASARFEGVEARTYRSAEGLILKAYNHTDARGTLARIEVRPPAAKLTWDELEAFFEGRQPLGRDAKIEALTMMVEDLSRGVVMMKRELRALNRKVDGGSPIGSPLAKGGSDDAVR